MISRSILAALLAASVAGFSPTAAAQGCTPAAPCPWDINIDADGFVFLDPEQTEWSWEEGETFLISVYNDDASNHQLTSDDLGFSFTAFGLDDERGPITEFGPVQFQAAGTYHVRDESAAATARIVIEAIPSTQPAPAEPSGEATIPTDPGAAVTETATGNSADPAASAAADAPARPHNEPDDTAKNVPGPALPALLVLLAFAGRRSRRT